MQLLLFDWFTRSRLSAIISAFEFIWKAARHKIFYWNPSFVDKRMYQKIRFCELTTDEIQEIMDKAVPETTKKATKFGMRLFNGTYVLSFPYNLQNFKCDR